MLPPVAAATRLLPFAEEATAVHNRWLSRTVQLVPKLVEV